MIVEQIHEFIRIFFFFFFGNVQCSPGIHCRVHFSLSKVQDLIAGQTDLAADQQLLVYDNTLLTQAISPMQAAENYPPTSAERPIIIYPQNAPDFTKLAPLEIRKKYMIHRKLLSSWTTRLCLAFIFCKIVTSKFGPPPIMLKATRMRKCLEISMRNWYTKPIIG